MRPDARIKDILAGAPPFQSPPPRRGACDSPRNPASGTPGPRTRGFNPLRRGGGRATSRRAARSPSRRAPSFNPLRRGGGRATLTDIPELSEWADDRFNPLRRGGGRATLAAAERSRPGGPGILFQSPPPRRGACDGQKRRTRSLPDEETGFNPLRRGGGRATHPPDHGGRGGGPRVSIPSAEAGGVRPARSERRSARPRSRFNPLRRGGGRATAGPPGTGKSTVIAAFQSPPPRRGACDPRHLPG